MTSNHDDALKFLYKGEELEDLDTEDGEATRIEGAFQLRTGLSEHFGPCFVSIGVSNPIIFAKILIVQDWELANGCDGECCPKNESSDADSLPVNVD